MYEHEDITNLLENAGLGTAGTDIFAYHSPPDVSNCIIVYPSNDPPAIDPERPFYMKAKFQVIVRNSDYRAGLEKCKLAQAALTFNETETGQMKVKQCRPLYQARVYRRSGSGELEFSITFQVIYVQK
jgi:hypothetical protein